MRPVVGEYQGLMGVLKGKLARITYRVLTIWIEQIPAVMQELVVRIPPNQIRLLRRVAMVVLVYIEVAEVSVAEEAKEAGDQDDQGDQDGQGGQDQIQGHFMDCNPNFVYLYNYDWI